MKNTLLFTVGMLISAMLIATVPTEAEAAIYEDTVRLHILAPSDSAEDQALKLFIRDKLLEKYSSELSAVSCAEDAAKELLQRKCEIEEDCDRWIAESGYEYTAECRVEREWYNTREYGDITMPAGEYSSLVITIGEGEGQNWWCVMYPPLCLDAATATDTSYTQAENALITRSGYRVKFKLLEVTAAISKGFSQ